MRSLALTLAFCITPPLFGDGTSPKPMEIPLEDIWALDMPGTRDIRELDPRTSTKETMIGRIGRTLGRSGMRAKAGACFVVRGEDGKALASAVNVLVDGEKPSESIPANEDVSLVFYSYPAPGYVVLDSVRRSAEHVTVNYRVIVHQTAEITIHVALIPLGKLSAGRLIVDVVEVNRDDSTYDSKHAERAVCDSCSFDVRDGGTQR